MKSLPHARKRQWGAEKRTRPLPTVHPRPSNRTITWSRVAIVLTVVFWAVYVVTTVIRQFIDGGRQDFRFTMEAIGYLVVVTFLTFSALMYLVAREGALQRFSKHVRVPRAELDRHFAENRSSITVLVPSYAEEPHVVRATLLSAALQEYPSIKVVLLLDDPPFPKQPSVLSRLEETRALADDISAMLAEPRDRFAAALADFEAQISSGALADDLAIDHAHALAEHYAFAARWLTDAGEQETLDDHVDLFFVEQVLGGLADELLLTGRAIATSVEEDAVLSADRIGQLYRRLAWTFDADLDVFERKRFASTSHEANKAMNLNAYIGLMGGQYTLAETPNGPALLPAAAGEP
ncbi:MAG: glycosyltransferase family 2 protein, partial [Leifsonia flava]